MGFHPIMKFCYWSCNISLNIKDYSNSGNIIKQSSSGRILNIPLYQKANTEQNVRIEKTPMCKQTALCKKEDLSSSQLKTKSLIENKLAKPSKKN